MKKMFFYLILLFLSTECFGQIPEAGDLNLRGPYFGQKTPGMVPEIFAKGIISIPDSKFCTISFSGKMDEFYVYRWNGDKAEILFSQNKDGKWTPLQEVSFTDGIKAIEPHITFDGNKIYFCWEKPTPAGEQEIPFKIWYTERTPEGWTEPKYAGPGMFVSCDKEGTIYTTDMTSVMTNGKTYLAKVKSENNKFVSFEKLSIPQYLGTQAHPCIAPDGSFIIFDVESGHHLLVSFKKQDGTWGDAIDLTKNGFDDMAGGASITPDGKYIFFNVHGLLMWVNIRIIKRLNPKE